MVEHASRLRWVHSTAAAVVSSAQRAGGAKYSGHKLTWNPGGNDGGVRHGGLLVIARRFHLMLEAQRERRWIQNELTRDTWPWSVRAGG